MRAVLIATLLACAGAARAQDPLDAERARRREAHNSTAAALGAHEIALADAQRGLAALLMQQRALEAEPQSFGRDLRLDDVRVRQRLVAQQVVELRATCEALGAEVEVQRVALMDVLERWLDAHGDDGVVVAQLQDLGRAGPPAPVHEPVVAPDIAGLDRDGIERLAMLFERLAGQSDEGVRALGPGRALAARLVERLERLVLRDGVKTHARRLTMARADLARFDRLIARERGRAAELRRVAAALDDAANRGLGRPEGSGG